jgi:hypothetical protein
VTVAQIFGPDIIIVVFVLFFGVGLLGTSIFAIVDAAQRPNEAFIAAGSNKALWISLIAALTIFYGIGTILAIIYLAAVRPRIIAATSS